MLVMSFQILTYCYYIVTFASSVYFILFFAEIFSSEFQIRRLFTPSDYSMSNIWDKWKLFLARVSQHFSMSRGLPYPRFRKCTHQKLQLWGQFMRAEPRSLLLSQTPVQPHKRYTILSHNTISEVRSYFPKSVPWVWHSTSLDSCKVEGMPGWSKFWEILISFHGINKRQDKHFSPSYVYLYVVSFFLMTGWLRFFFMETRWSKITIF